MADNQQSPPQALPQSQVLPLTQPSAELKTQPRPLPLSPAKLSQSAGLASPSRLRSSSPRLSSPASTEIFERNVQEPVSIASLGGEEQAAHIPSHVVTEDAIPPALEASAQAITSDSLNPDEVEIVMTASHQPAASVLDQSVMASHSDITSLNSASLFQSQTASTHDEQDPTSSTASISATAAPAPAVAGDEETASTYGQLDPNDVRRLSFISFKDIVLAEHQQAALAGGEIGSRDSIYSASQDRTASPLRSPRSPTSTYSQSFSGGVVTPPPPGVSVNPAIAAVEGSPVRGMTFGSPQTAQQHGELTIETMRQALRKTASGDLSGASARAGGTLSPAGEEASAGLLGRR